eukprot:12927862-Alexandrium_andersonii.AAC.1
MAKGNPCRKDRRALEEPARIAPTPGKESPKRSPGTPNTGIFTLQGAQTAICNPLKAHQRCNLLQSEIRLSEDA